MILLSNVCAVFPFGADALGTEQLAGKMINEFAETIDDPLIKEAIALQAREESRHGRLIQFLIKNYGIEIDEPHLKTVDERTELAFTEFGFDECVDSFLAFGIFKLARLSNFFPEPLFAIFDTVLDEEASHIVFFINWFAYLQASRGQNNQILRAGRSLWYYTKAVRHVMAIAGSASNEEEEKEFTLAGADTFIDNLTLNLLPSRQTQAKIAN